MVQKTGRATQPAHVMLATVLDPYFTHNRQHLPHRLELICDIIVNPMTRKGLAIPDGHDLLVTCLLHLLGKLERRKGGVNEKLRKKCVRAVRHVNAQKRLAAAPGAGDMQTEIDDAECTEGTGSRAAARIYKDGVPD